MYPMGILLRFIFYYVYGFVCIYVSAPCEYNTLKDQKRASYALELELRAVSCHVPAESQTWVLLKSSESS